MIAFAYEERFELQLTVSKMDSIRDRPQLSVLYYRGVGFITGAQPKAGTGLRMQMVRFFNVTLLGIYR